VEALWLRPTAVRFVTKRIY